MKENYTITIGRQLGSGGKLIGQLLSQRLGIPCYDRELLQIAAQESGIRKALFEKADEINSHIFPANYFSSHSLFMGYSENNYLCNETLFKIQSDVIIELASKESCIFVGRCADYILRDTPRCLKIFICATLNDRISRIMNDCGISEKEARQQIERTDRKRAAYYNYYSNKSWGIATSYDLCLNSSTLGVEEIVSIVQEHIRKL